MVFSIFCVLVVYIIILVYQLNVIDNIYNIFLAFFYNYIQRDKLVNLHASICSGYFYYLGFVNYTEYVTIDEYKNFIRDMAQQYSSSYHIFYQNYIKYRFALGRDLTPIYIDYNFTKVHVSWDEYNTQNNYIEEAEVMIYQCTSSALTDKMEDIIEDIKIFFNSRFKSNPQKLKSIYGQIMYYMNKNMENAFILFFRNIQNEIDETQQNYSKKSRSLSTLIEVLGFLLNMVTFISCIYFLGKSNLNLYKFIINLFIDFTQEGNYSFKNSYDNFLLAEKLTRLKFLLNNFSVKAIDNYNKKINYNSLSNKNDFEENDNYSLASKPSSGLKKKDENLLKKKKSKIQKNTNININENKDNKINTTNNNSMTISKSQNKLLNTVSVNLISKLNQNLTPDKNNINASTKNSLNPDSSSQNINTNNKKFDDNEENILTKEMIYEKLKIIEINTIKFFSYSCYGLIVILLAYLLMKLYETYDYYGKSKNLFVDYSVVTLEYSMIINYFNRLNLILVNQPMGREDILLGMQNEVENQFKKSEEVKSNNIENYEIINTKLKELNNQNDTKKLSEALCRDSEVCFKIFDSKYNVLRKGVDVGLKTIAQEIYNMFDDYRQLKNEIKNLSDVDKYFMNENFMQIDLSLNFLLTEVEDICAEAFLIEAEDLINDFKAVIISLNVFIIIFLTVISICLIILLINRITFLLSLIEKSSTRISISINFLKEKNFGNKNKSGTFF